MEQIEEGIYIETGYTGATLGTLALPLGTILIDSPPCPDESRSWRAALRNLGSGVNRLLINLDDHYDRTLGARAMDCPVMAHTETAASIRSRSTVFKGLTAESGAAWENCIGLSGIRWVVPTLTFDISTQLHWDAEPLILEHHPGPTPGSVWVVIPHKKVVFVGDTVYVNEPPFLGSADLEAWIESLNLLLSAQFRDYLVISSRGGPVPVEVLREQRRSLKYLHGRLTAFAEREEHPETTETLIPKLLSNLDYPAELQSQYRRRLAYGLYHYYSRYYWPNEVLTEE